MTAQCFPSKGKKKEKKRNFKKLNILNHGNQMVRAFLEKHFIYRYALK